MTAGLDLASSPSLGHRLQYGGAFSQLLRSKLWALDLSMTFCAPARRPDGGACVGRSTPEKSLWKVAALTKRARSYEHGPSTAVPTPAVGLEHFALARG